MLKTSRNSGKMFDGITVNITDSKYIVRAQTEFTSNINTLFESFKGMTSKIISYDSRVEINYYINIPEYLNLKIENKYGDVYMEDNTGEFRITYFKWFIQSKFTWKKFFNNNGLLRCKNQFDWSQGILMPHFQKFHWGN